MTDKNQSLQGWLESRIKECERKEKVATEEANGDARRHWELERIILEQVQTKLQEVIAEIEALPPMDYSYQRGFSKEAVRSMLGEVKK